MPTPAADAVTARLLELYTAAWRDIENQLFQLALDPPERRAVLRRRLRALSRDIGAEMNGLDRQMRAWLQDQFPEVYRLAAVDAADELGTRFAWSQHHRDAVQVLARRTFDDLLSATKFVRADAKRLVRQAALTETARSIIGGTPAAAAGRDLATTIRRTFGTDPLAAVRYSNGARHSLADYADTVLRTTTATAFNQGTLNTAADSGVQWVEIFDGADCGWRFHDDPDKANGTIRTLDDAMTHLVAHPRCARGFGLRPDLTTAADARAARRFTPDEQEQMAAEERARAGRQPARLSRPAQARRQQIIDRRAARTGG